MLSLYAHYVTRKSCSKTSTKAALIYRLTTILKIVCSQKVIRLLADNAVYICQIRRRSAGNFFLKRANKYFFVSGPSNYRVDYMGIKMSQKIPQWYMMAI